MDPQRGRPEGAGDPEISGRAGLPSPGAVLLLMLAAALLFLMGGLPLQLLFGEAGLLFAQILFLLGPAVAFLYWGGYDLRRSLALRAPEAPQILSGALLLAGGVGIAWFLAWAQSVFIPVPVEYLEALERVLVAETVSRFLWLLLLVAVVPAVAEEVLFRGVLLSGLRSRLPDLWAVLLSGLIFGLFHVSPETAFRVIPTAWLGILLAWVVVVTGSLPLAMMLHLVNNSVILGLTTIPAAREALLFADRPPPFYVLPLALALLAAGAYGLLAREGGRAGTREPGPRTDEAP